MGMSTGGVLRLLSDSEVEAVNETALAILEQVGVRMHHHEACMFLSKAGAAIADGNLVKFPRSLVKRALESAPAQFRLYNRDLTDSFVWGGSEVHFGASGSAIGFLDSDGKTYRPPTTDDLLKMYQLADALPGVSWLMPGMIVGDVPKTLAGVWRFYLRLKYGSKPSSPDGLSVEDLIDNLDLLEVVRGGEEALAEKPFGPLIASPTPPLRWTEEGMGFLLEGARRNLPIEFIPMPFSGAGAPSTIAGSLAQHVAENLSGIIAAQVVNPGTPCVFGGGPAYMEPYFGCAVLASIEALMLHVGYTQMGKYYDLPTGTGDCIGQSDSKIDDFQAGAESALSQVLVALAGNNGTVGMGFLEAQSTYSLEKLVADHEICRSVKKLLRGAEVSPDTLAFEVIKEVGPGGEFLSHAHTLAWLRKEYLVPSVFNRQDRTGWENGGAKDTHDLAREEVQRILAGSELHRLESSVDKELDERMDRILRRRGFHLGDFRSFLPA
jgi:trimethylamine--corrinoid protein Co-methyltransferase